MNYFSHLKNKWEIKSNFQFAIIFIVFGITGSTSLKIAKTILEFLNIAPTLFDDVFLGLFWYWILRILIIFPVYQILLIIFGFIFFQFKFFWEFEKKILKRMGIKRFFTEKP